jgi:tetratricopeptide (TPR) repeat protein
LTEPKDPWDYLKAKQYSEAVRAYSRRYAKSHDVWNLRGRAQALLLSDQPAEALQDFRQIIEMTEPRLQADSDFINQGICHWYLDQHKQAIAAWRHSLSAPYTDAAGGVVRLAILLYAAVRLRDEPLEAEALRFLRGQWQKHQRRVQRNRTRATRQGHEDFVRPGLYAWPGAIVPFLLGKISGQELDQAASQTPVDVLQVRQQCQADFHVGVRALREGKEMAFRERMVRCAASQYGELENEFCLARWEVAHGFPPQPFTGGVA